MAANNNYIPVNGGWYNYVIGKEIAIAAGDTIKIFRLGEAQQQYNVAEDDLKILQHLIDKTPLGKTLIDMIGLEQVSSCCFQESEVIDPVKLSHLCLGIYQRSDHFKYNDVLTGLPNRRKLYEGLEEKIAAGRKSVHPLCCLFIDLDRLAEINHKYGFECGDRVICRIAALLRDSVKPSDMVVRYAGDEFVIIMEQAEGKAGIALAGELVRLAAGKALDNDDASLEVSISIGVFACEEAMTGRELLAGSDEMLHRAKMRGRGQVYAGGPDM